jgi:putative oxidoreductase
MNRFTSYAAVVLRAAVGLVFLNHGIMKVHMGVAGVTGFFHGVGIPFAHVAALLVIALETVGAALMILGLFTRLVAMAFVIEMTVAILAAVLPSGQTPELEGLLLAGSLALMALGSGPLALGGMLKKGE